MERLIVSAKKGPKSFGRNLGVVGGGWSKMFNPYIAPPLPPLTLSLLIH